MEDLAKQIIETWGKLDSERANHRDLWDDLARFFLPEMANRFHDGHTVNDTREARPLDGVGIMAARDLTNFLVTNSVSQGKEWFQLRMADDDIQDESAVKDWTATATRKATLALQDSNFMEALDEMFSQFAPFGAGCLYEEIDAATNRLRFKCYPIQSICLAEDPWGRVDTVYRKFEYTAKQAVQTFGDAVSKKIKDCADKPGGAVDKFYFIQAIYPRMKRRPGGKGAKNMAIASVVVEVDAKTVVEEGGYIRNPFQVVRFSRVPGDAYGRGPGHVARPDMLSIERLWEMVFDAVESDINPSWAWPDAQSIDEIDLSPGAMNAWDATRGEPFRLTGSGNLGVPHTLLLELRSSIRQAFIIHTFLTGGDEALAGGEKMTATEVAARAEEKTVSLSPLVNRLEAELFGPMVTRVVWLLIEAGIIEPPPASIAKPEFRVVYTSQMDAKLSEWETAIILRSVQEVAGVMEAFATFPQFSDALKLPELTRRLLENRHMDPDLMYTMKETKTNERKRNEAAAQQQAEQAIVDNVKPVDLQQPAQPGSPMAQMEGGL